MSSLSNYFHPDEVMLKLAGLISDGLKYHAAAMHLVSADDQIDDLAYEEAIEEAEKESQDPKMAVAMAFRDNKLDALPKIRQFYKPQLKLNVTFNRMRRRFRKEIARITTVPVLKPPSNVNVPDENALPNVARGNVASMDEFREKRRKRA